jgi:hypothetical protein
MASMNLCRVFNYARMHAVSLVESSSMPSANLEFILFSAEWRIWSRSE